MPDNSHVHLVVPGTRDHLRLARLTASGMAAAHRLPTERVEAVRAAVDAVGASLIETGQGRPLRLELQVRPGMLEITGTTDHVSDVAPDSVQMEINHLTLSLLSSSHQMVEVDGQAVMRVQIPLHSRT